MFDAFGRSPPHGYTVTNPGRSGSVTVTFNDTADASAGIPARPAIGRASTDPAPRDPIPRNWPSTVDMPGPDLVSNTRAGAKPTNPGPPAACDCPGLPTTTANSANA